MTRDDVDTILVSLDVGDTPALFVLLSSDGSINRIGDGSIGGDQDMFIGVTREPLFQRLRDKIAESFLEHAVSYELPDRVGSDCTLSIRFIAGGQETGLIFKYGSESEGPPQDVYDFVRAAVDVTGPWHEAQKQMVARKSKPWWRFW